MSVLYELVLSEQWQAAITHIQSLSDSDAVEQIFHQSNTYGLPSCSPVATRRHWNSFSL